MDHVPSYGDWTLDKGSLSLYLSWVGLISLFNESEVEG